jgi:hypothetical protein
LLRPFITKKKTLKSQWRSMFTMSSDFQTIFETETGGDERIVLGTHEEHIRNTLGTH